MHVTLKVKSACEPKVAHQAGVYPGFYGMKRLGVFPTSFPGPFPENEVGVFLLLPGWDASPSQGYPTAINSLVPIYTPGWKEAP